MKYLIDTHIFIWWLTDGPKLSKSVLKIISNIENEIYFSAASSWEIIIKQGLGKLHLPEDAKVYIPLKMKEHSILPLSITHKHCLYLADLPLHHRDPFDRIILAQSMSEELKLISADNIFQRYSVQIIK